MSRIEQIPASLHTRIYPLETEFGVERKWMPEPPTNPRTVNYVTREDFLREHGHLWRS